MFVDYGKNGIWTQAQKLLSADGSADDEFGKSLNMDTHGLVVASWFDDNDKGVNSGHCKKRICLLLLKWD